MNVFNFKEVNKYKPNIPLIAKPQRFRLIFARLLSTENGHHEMSKHQGICFLTL